MQAAIAGAALVVAWRRQRELELPPVLGLALVLELGWIAVHLAHGVDADYDSARAFPREGNALLHGTYPESEYPPGAVLLFALDALLGGGSTRVSHAFLMIPFQIAVVAGIWSLRTRWSAWLATVAALWPLNAFFWEFKFDLVPAALLVLGLGLAVRDRWSLSGAVLGLGAAVKWFPALSVAALALWLLTARRRSAATAHVVAASVAFLVVNLPFLAWSPHEFLAAYRIQTTRGLIGESLPYIPLRVLGLARLEGGVWEAAIVPAWADAAASAVQTAAVAAALLVATRVRDDLRAGVATAAMSAVVFLMLNRVFSPQYLVVMTAAWMFAGSLVLRTARQQLLLGVLVFSATLANVLVYPTQARWWPAFSVLLFVCAGAATMLVYRAALASGPMRRSR
jgi:hypothetical protein